MPTVDFPGANQILLSILKHRMTQLVVIVPADETHLSEEELKYTSLCFLGVGEVKEALIQTSRFTMRICQLERRNRNFNTIICKTCLHP